LVSAKERKHVKNVRTFTEECAEQHKLILIDMVFKEGVKRKNPNNSMRIKQNALQDKEIRQKYQLGMVQNLGNSPNNCQNKKFARHVE